MDSAKHNHVGEMQVGHGFRHVGNPALILCKRLVRVPVVQGLGFGVQGLGVGGWGLGPLSRPCTRVEGVRGSGFGV